MSSEKQLKQQLADLIPKHKLDHEAAQAAILAGHPAVEPILHELLEWIQDMNWPVAQDRAPFLATIGEPLIPHIRKVLDGDDEVWKYWILGVILRFSESNALPFRDELERLAYSPNDQEFAEGLSDQAKSVLEKYGWQKIRRQPIEQN